MDDKENAGATAAGRKNSAAGKDSAVESTAALLGGVRLASESASPAPTTAAVDRKPGLLAQQLAEHAGELRVLANPSDPPWR